MRDYLLSFVIGSSFLTFAGFFLRVYTLEHRRYSYFSYTMVAPVYLGVMNALSRHLQKRYSWSDDQRFGFITLLSVGIVVTFARLTGVYEFSLRQWILYLLRLLLLHGLAYNLVMRSLERGLR
jgi:hypothetical protein